MGVLRPAHLTKRLIGAVLLGAAVLLCPDAPFAAESPNLLPTAKGPTLPPAEFKQLPVGTKVRYTDWQYEIKENVDNFTSVIKTNINMWYRIHGVFGRSGDRAYAGGARRGSSSRSFNGWWAESNEKALAAFKSLWPLEVGKKAEANFDDVFQGNQSVTIHQTIKLEVVGTEYLELNGLHYPTYVIHETNTHPQVASPWSSWSGAPFKSVSIHWYSPDAGVILKTEKEQLLGYGKAGYPGKISQFSLAKVTYPKGTTSHALKPVKVRKTSDKALIAEVERLKREKVEAEAVRGAEIARLRETLAVRNSAGGTVALASLTASRGVEFGRYHALIIGINKYQHLPNLKTAVNDARAVAKVLGEEYGFRTRLLINPIRREIVDALDEYREALEEKDNLLIYYAGHGWLDEEADRGYWLPVDAIPKRRSGWVSNATITDTLKALAAKHVMVVADSCYSGTLVRGAAMGARKRNSDYWKRMASKWTRVAITSGGLEPVADNGVGGHSPFAKAFIDTLRDNDGVIDGTQLFSKMRRPVMLAAKQTPQYSDVRGAGHDGGDFLFVRKK